MQNTISNIDKHRFTPFTVGFDELLTDYWTWILISSGYPPYNIIKTDDCNYIIEIAVAGFNKNRIEIELSDGELSVKSKMLNSKDSEQKKYYSPRYIARSFVEFTLSDEIRVKSADLNDGMLRIKLKKIIPEHRKPR